MANNYSGSASLSDSSGSLLFYLSLDTPFRLNNIVSGYDYAIYGNDNKIILNGDSLDVGTDLSGALFLTIPGSNSQYILLYLKTLDSASITLTKLYSSKIEKNGNGNYIVIEKNTLVFDYPFEAGITATKHVNGIDWWLILHGANTGGLIMTFVFLLLQRME